MSPGYTTSPAMTAPRWNDLQRAPRMRCCAAPGKSGPSDRLQRQTLSIGQPDRDRVIRMHHAADDHDAHDTRFPNDRPPRRAFKNRFDQALLKFLDLNARRAQAGDSNDGRFADLQQRAGRQSQQIQIARRDVFAEIAGADAKTLGVDLVEKFGLHQMDLAEIGPAGIFLGIVNMLNRDAAMRVPLDAEAFEQRDAGMGVLGESMCAVGEDAQDGWCCTQRNGSIIGDFQDCA
jgi:hypothetical protein